MLLQNDIKSCQRCNYFSQKTFCMFSSLYFLNFDNKSCFSAVVFDDDGDC